MAKKEKIGKHAKHAKVEEEVIQPVVQEPVVVAPVQSADPSVVQIKKEHKGLKIFGIVMGSIVGVLLVAYLAVALVFMGRFYPNTTLGKNDISLQSGDEVKSLLAERTSDYKLTVNGYSIDLTLSASDAGLALDTDAAVSSMLQAQEPFLWPLHILGDHDASTGLAASFSSSKLGQKVKEAVEKVNATAEASVDAKIAYNEITGKFEISKEKYGTKLDADAVTKACANALVTMQSKLRLTESELVPPSVFSTDTRLKTACDKANSMLKTNYVLTMGGDPAVTIDSLVVSGMIEFTKDWDVKLSDEKLTAWVDKTAEECTTVGKERTYTRPDGKVCTVKGGSYGWTVKRDDLLALTRDVVNNGKTGTGVMPTEDEASGWTSKNQDWGKRYCDVDLTEQHARFYDATGTLVWETDVITGIPDGKHDTPSGVYYIVQKESPSKLVGEKDASGNPEYETTVQYWMPFVGNGIGLHDASWQPSFGGQMYKQGYGSHGCVNLPVSKAAEIYSIIEPNDVVVVHW